VDRSRRWPDLALRLEMPAPPPLSVADVRDESSMRVGTGLDALEALLRPG
jgi:hypothetical protein